MTADPQLIIVIPVYNEQESLPALLHDWSAVCTQLDIQHEFLIIDDGSKDNSLAILHTLQTAIPTLKIISQPNAGHGPAILKGYHTALDREIHPHTPPGPRPEWIFQIDSDHQFDTLPFTTLWNNRDRYDLLLGERREKHATPARQFISMGSRSIVRILFGRGVKDVNSPYRLMRAATLTAPLDLIPPDAFAPNILITAWYIRKKYRIITTTVEFRKNIRPRISGMNSYFVKGCLRSMVQTLQFRFRR